jgi:hypothetical protein
MHDIRRTAEKRHTTIYGIFTDGLQYHFMRIGNNSTVRYSTIPSGITNLEAQVTKSHPIEWGLGAIGNKSIVSYIRYIVRAAINSPPATPPAGQGGQTEASLDAYNSGTESYSGFRSLGLDGDDDEGEALFELSDIE